jgi:hypothetical protein
MVPRQFAGGPELWFVLLCFALVSVPAFVGVVALLNRATGSDRDERLAELERRVEELESERE